MELYRLIIPACPPSLNRVGGQGHWRRWYEAKKRWQALLLGQLIAIDLPKDLGAVTASAQLRYPNRRRRDSDNHSALIAKSLGDALQQGGYLEDDTPQHYQFEPVCFAHGPRLGEQTTVLLVQGVQPSLFEGAWEDVA